MHGAAVLCLLLMNEVTYLGIILHLPTCSRCLVAAGTCSRGSLFGESLLFQALIKVGSYDREDTRAADLRRSRQMTAKGTGMITIHHNIPLLEIWTLRSSAHATQECHTPGVSYKHSATSRISAHFFSCSRCLPGLRL